MRYKNEINKVPSFLRVVDTKYENVVQCRLSVLITISLN